MSAFNRFSLRSLAVAAAASFFTLTLSGTGHAEPTFPGVIQRLYGGDCVPQCTLCHNKPEGGLGNYQPSELDGPSYVAKMAPDTGEGAFFANFVHVIQGRLPTNDASLENDLKLYAMTPCNSASTKACDSDGDGILDMQEFAQNGDPNGGDLCVGPKYGCGASIKPLPKQSNAAAQATAVLALLGVGIVIARRVRR